jgi:hypothetical protein
VQAPNAWSSDWTCGVHGAVLPLHPPKSPSKEGLSVVLRDARVPLWVPWPLPLGWLVTGFLHAGDDRTGSRACAVALSGPALLSGPADMLLVAEELGVGLGAYFAGLDGPDPGGVFDASPPHAKAEIRGHPVPLWAVEAAGPDRAAFIGEAMGHWLWAVLWPSDAGVLMLEQMHLRDLRDPDMELDLPYGAICPRLFSSPEGGSRVE